EATVKSHLVHSFGKLDVDSRTKVVAEARRRGLL
ncbi:MAG: response regulator transcription factor, partial [Mycobacteriaceae bacterium]|nr:response regulator transcription factor [Mycobacteriaceae bacterium]